MRIEHLESEVRGEPKKTQDQQDCIAKMNKAGQ
jgi:hypothetical protein